MLFWQRFFCNRKMYTKYKLYMLLPCLSSLQTECNEINHLDLLQRFVHKIWTKWHIDQEYDLRYATELGKLPMTSLHLKKGETRRWIFSPFQARNFTLPSSSYCLSVTNDTLLSTGPNSHPSVVLLRYFYKSKNKIIFLF